MQSPELFKKPMVLALEMIPYSNHGKSEGISHCHFWDSVGLGGGRVGGSRIGKRGGKERSQADEGAEGPKQPFPVCPLSG